MFEIWKNRNDLILVAKRGNQRDNIVTAPTQSNLQDGKGTTSDDVAVPIH